MACRECQGAARISPESWLYRVLSQLDGAAAHRGRLCQGADPFVGGLLDCGQFAASHGRVSL